MSSFFRMKTELVDCFLEIQHKYNLVLGDSGTGKSTLLSETIKSLTLQPDAVYSDLEVCPIENKSSLSIIDGSKRLYICDEFLATKVIALTKGDMSYCIIVTRKVFKHINLHYECIFKMIRDPYSSVSTIEPAFVFNYEDICKFKYDMIITEDAGDGNCFFNKLLNSYNVVPAGGKSNIDAILDKEDHSKTILVIADAGGLASEANKLLRRKVRFSKKGGNLVFCLPECFEHVLLCSEFLGFDKDIKPLVCPAYSSTENFCETVLEWNTRGKPFYHAHGKKNDMLCWVENCSDCNKRPACEYFKTGNKFKSVLENGPVSDLLNLITT